MRGMNAPDPENYNKMLKGEIQHLGGAARAKKLSAERRKEIAAMGAAARWGRKRVRRKRAA